MPGPFPMAGMIPTTAGPFVVSSTATGYMTFATTSLGTFGFEAHDFPTVNTIRKFKSVQSVMTMSSAQVKDFDFQPDEFGVVGNEYVLRWEIMDQTLFNTMKQFYESTEEVVWDPKERARIPGETYVVLIRDLRHDSDHRTTTNLLSVEMVVNIRSVV